MPAPKKIDYEEFERLHKNGWTRNQLAAHYGVNVRTVSRARNHLGLSGPHHGRTMTPERLANIRRMIDDGWSHAEITRTEGADKETLARHFPGTAWTREQHAEYMRINHLEKPRFNRHPKAHNKRKHQEGGSLGEGHSPILHRDE